MTGSPARGIAIVGMIRTSVRVEGCVAGSPGQGLVTFAIERTVQLT